MATNMIACHQLRLNRYTRLPVSQRTVNTKMIEGIAVPDLTPFPKMPAARYPAGHLRSMIGWVNLEMSKAKAKLMSSLVVA